MCVCSISGIGKRGGRVRLVSIVLYAQVLSGLACHIYTYPIPTYTKGFGKHQNYSSSSLICRRVLSLSIIQTRRAPASVNTCLVPSSPTILHCMNKASVRLYSKRTMLLPAISQELVEMGQLAQLYQLL
ncbi:hypothetical protein F5B19DRAFT_409742 [Rostrohypoxylon terebratum]|nr:hypothetical protein F5B19DRAFT_409742 [Rostrohypoxylon terebratum]